MLSSISQCAKPMEKLCVLARKKCVRHHELCVQRVAHCNYLCIKCVVIPDSSASNTLVVSTAQSPSIPLVVWLFSHVSTAPIIRATMV